MKKFALVFAVVVGGALLWQLTREDRTPERADTAQTGPVDVDADPERGHGSTEQPANESAERPKHAVEHLLVGVVTGDAPLDGVSVTAQWEGGHAGGETDTEGHYSYAVPAQSKTIFLRLLAHAPDPRCPGTPNAARISGMTSR